MEQRQCPVCRGQFTPRSANQRFCCKQHSKAHQNATKRGTLDALLIRGGVGEPFDCAECDTHCVPGKDGVDAKATRFCDYGCKAKWHKANSPQISEETALQRFLSEPTPREISNYRKVLKADPCAYCGGQSDSIDHIVPIAEGGEDGWENYTGACRRCNAVKQALPLLVALIWVPLSREYNDMRRQIYAPTPG